LGSCECLFIWDVHCSSSSIILRCVHFSISFATLRSVLFVPAPHLPTWYASDQSRLMHHSKKCMCAVLQFTRLRQKARKEQPGRQLRSMDSAWTASVNSQAPWPEYPRPQMQRDAWLSLNGVWEFAGYQHLTCTAFINYSGML